MVLIKNDYYDEKECREFEGIILSVEKSSYDVFITFKDKNDNVFFCETTLQELPEKNKRYKLYIYENTEPWFINAFEEIPKEQEEEPKTFKYRSKGEYEISKFLEEMDITFIYEKPFLVKDMNGYDRIYYPDFYLTEYGIIIEFFGVTGNESYEKVTQMKKDVYLKEYFNLITIEKLENNWQIDILEKIDKIIKQKETDFNMKKFNFMKSKSLNK